jgi:hypothetical protein
MQQQQQQAGSDSGQQLAQPFECVPAVNDVLNLVCSKSKSSSSSSSSNR